MTLIEVLVALALLSMLSIAMIGTFQVAQRSYVRSLRTAQEADELVSAQRFLRRAIEGAIPIEPGISSALQYGLVGSEEALSILAPAPSASTSSAVLRYAISVRRHGNAADLIVGSSAGDEVIDPASAPGGFNEGEVLLRDVASAQWSYAIRTEVDGKDVLQWSHSWTGHTKPPALVKLEVLYPSGDRRRWPLFIVDPRATDDAHCEFDVVGQVCRSHGG